MDHKQDSTCTCDACLNQRKSKTAFEMALDTRKFEIGLYWTRASYFWAFILVLLGAYGTLAIKHQTHFRAVIQALGLLFVAGSGVVFSLAWLFVNRASKFWQKNWEWHVDLLEEAQVGSVYRKVYSEKLDPWDVTKAYPYSISNINALLSLYVLLTFSALFIGSFVLFAHRLATAEGHPFLSINASLVLASITGPLIVLFVLFFIMYMSRAGLSSSHRRYEEWLAKGEEIAKSGRADIKNLIAAWQANSPINVPVSFSARQLRDYDIAADISERANSSAELKELIKLLSKP